MWPTLTSNISAVEIMPEEPRRVIPAPDRVALDKTSLRAERRIFVELLGAITGLDVEHEVVVADVAAGGVV